MSRVAESIVPFFSPAVQRVQQSVGRGVNPATLDAVRAEDEARARSRSPGIVVQPPQDVLHVGAFFVIRIV